VGVKQTEAQKYATEIIIRFKEYDHYLREYHECPLAEPSAKIERSTFESQKMQPEITLGVPASLLRNRPDVIAAEYNLITNFEMTNVKSGFYPSLRVTATGGFQSIDLKSGLVPTLFLPISLLG
jgi:outer membrane protein TolC